MQCVIETTIKIRWLGEIKIRSELFHISCEQCICIIKYLFLDPQWIDKELDTLAIKMFG